MTKGKTPKAITAATPNRSLKQARLIGLNDHIKSIRQKPSTPHDGLKQVSLASFGFSNASKKSPERTIEDLLETPPRKRQKRLPPDVEVPETQFAQNTQSPELNDYDAFAGLWAEYSSPLSSPLSSPPPEEGESQASVSSMIAMPPPPAPVTPKRRRVVEVPDSKSPPTTPFTPYQSQHEEGRRGTQASPTARLNTLPVVPKMEGVEEDIDEDEYHSPTIKRTGRVLFTSSPTRLREEKADKVKSQKTKGETQEQRTTIEIGEVKEVVASGRERTINSSQWWDLEDTQYASLSTQSTQSTQTWKITPPSQAQEPFHVDLSYKNEPSFEGSGNDTPKPQDANHIGDYEDTQEPFRSMTYPMPLEFHDDPPELGPEKSEDGDKTRPIIEVEDPVLPMGEDTASRGGLEPEDGSEEIPQYDAYRTQQFPSSFWQHGGTSRCESPELMSSQWVPEAVGEDCPARGEMEDDEGESSQWATPGITSESKPTGTEDGREEPSQWIVPEIVDEPGPIDRGDERQYPQFLPQGTHLVVENMKDRDLGEAAPSQLSPGTVVSATESLATGDEEYNLEDIPSSLPLPRPNPIVADEKYDGDLVRKEFKHHDDGDSGALTTSQLLPSELMETFPMPPPLSQYSGYDYGYDDLNIESETQ